MKFSDEGIIISQKNYGESSAIVKIFSQQHGVYRGFVRSARSPKSKTIFQIGNLVSFEFHSRTEENLGQFFSVDLIKSYCSKIIFEKIKIDCASSLFSIVDAFFFEHENHVDFFYKLQNFLQKITAENITEGSVIASYIKLELELLKSLGYGIDLSSCVATNSTIDLAFVSPKSARAVSFLAGKPYENKLLKLPNFLTGESKTFEESCLLDGLKLSGFFLKKFLLEDEGLGKKTHDFSKRDNLVKTLEKTSQLRIN